MKVTFVCDRCGGNRVMRDAWAKWDEVAQRWVLATINEYDFCRDCREETNARSRPLSASAYTGS